jgi:hypothetical protein
MANSPRKVTLNHSMQARRLPDLLEEIPKGSEITILDDAYSLIEWHEEQFLVHKDSLITFEEHE